MTRRSGTTLIELLVVVTVLGVLAGIVAFSAGSRGEGMLQPDAQAGRRRAVLSGKAITEVDLSDSGQAALVRYLPDGRTIRERINGR